MSWRRKITIEGEDAFLRSELRRLHQEVNGDFWRDKSFWTGIGIGIGMALVAITALDLIWVAVPV